ncbi:MAG: hypothetical protein KAU62_05790 [Candidatus Heimdallarchaeota archaeon]|nr:hypothetical protein [Candidatus Heimdallarchaeota archaeon]MCG3255577.1 hypothetical protein [Candidatus Heimdallarchaeota archaeon]MCK4610652.1 hypothetical protein [Candidatus Heimdallarchaeota archaeon]
MHIVVNSKQERNILIQLFNSLEKKDMNFFLDFEDPLSLQIESIFDDLCSCEILIDKEEEPLGIV